MKYLFLIIIFSGCYSAKKAAQQFSRAVAFDPAIPANYCARQYPPHDTTIHDTTTNTDTLVIAGQSTTDTVTINDTVRITTTIQLPGKVITNTVKITDTIKVTNNAALDACKIENSKLIANLNPITADRDKYKKRARTYFWILLALGAIIGVGVYSKIANILKPKV